MPLRRGIADDDRRVVPLTSDGAVRLQAPAGQQIDSEALAGVLDQPRTEEWTGMTVRAMESPEWMELFVSCSLQSGLIRMLFPQTAKGTVLTQDPYPSSTAAVDKDAITYLARRLSERKTPEGGRLWEYGVIGHGPGSDALAAKVADAGRTEVADDYWGGIESVIQLDEAEFPLDSVQGLAEFSHLLVVWHFDQASPDDVEYHARSPRGNTQWPATGTFAHRNHRRPNQLAQSFPRLLKVDGLRLHVTDLDAVVGPKVYDLSPYFEELGPRGAVHEPAWPRERLRDYWADKT